MKLYHGSKKDLEKISNHQVSRSEELIEALPEKQFLDGIYLTPEYDFALAMAVKPKGLNHTDNSKKTITFENPELFDEKADVFIYTFDSEQMPADRLEYIDNLQYILKGENELIPTKKDNLKAGDLWKYYTLNRG